MWRILLTRREVLTLGLTWRDAVSTGALCLVVIAYFMSLQGAPALISSVWATTAVVLILGCGCAVSAAGDLYTRPHSGLVRLLRGVITAFGTIAMFAGLVGLVFGSAFALRILVMATIILWVLGTTRHAYTIGSTQ
jgi:hypothetical protein